MSAAFPRAVSDIETELARLRSQAAAQPNLNFGGGDGTSGTMEALVDAKIAAAEARTDAKFASVLAKLDTLTGEVRSARSSIWTAAFAIMGLIVALVAIIATVAPSAFSMGAQVRDIARAEVQQSTPVVAPAPVAVPAPAATPATK